MARGSNALQMPCGKIHVHQIHCTQNTLYSSYSLREQQDTTMRLNSFRFCSTY